MGAVSTFCQSVTCPTCAGELSLINAKSSGLLSIAILECPTCEREWEVTGRIVAHGRSRAAVERAEQSSRDAKRRVRELASV